MEAISQDQFRVDHLRQRIAQITVEHEDRLASAAIEKQVLLQQLQEKTLRVKELEAQVAEHTIDRSS